MKKSKRKLRYTKDSVVLSDTLPYETPLTFSNRHFYKFLKENYVSLNIQDKKQFVEYSPINDPALETIVKLLFQLPTSPKIERQIQISSLSDVQSVIDFLIHSKRWTCFSFTMNPKPKLRIINKAAFIDLLNNDTLRSFIPKINASPKRIHFDDLGQPILRIIELLLLNHCNIHLDVKTRILRADNKHTIFSSILDFYTITNNTVNIKDLKKIPFNYTITHKENDFRELSVPHPKSQLEVVAFYEQFKELIIYYCNQSQFSIRKPHKVSSHFFVNDKLHNTHQGDVIDSIEESGKEYESLKTFFTYKKYPNIHKFYEDYRYHRAEKKYNSMYKFDIAKCFDSIYTHSVVWALYNKDHIKDNITSADKSFPGKFDSLMQNANFGETNGILIGPEFSRIFAELILQGIDKDVECKLQEQHNLLFKKDYEIYRYVDDYFIFYNEEAAKDIILTLFKITLRQFKMSISDSKSQAYSKPLITELTIAKSKIVDLFQDHVYFKIHQLETDPEELPIFKSIEARCNSTSLITKFKIIIRESNVEYKDIMNFTLAILNIRFEKTIKDFGEYYNNLHIYVYKNSLDPITYPLTSSDQTKMIKQENSFTSYLLELLDFAFFIFAVNPRVNFTIKLCHILSRLITTFDEKVKFFTGTFRDVHNSTGRIYSSPNNKYQDSNKGLIYKKISDEIRFLLEKNKMKPYAQIESLYLLIALQQLGNEYRISQDLLLKYFQAEEVQNKITFIHQPSYFVITVLLFYIRDSKPYKKLVNGIKESILGKITNTKGNKNRNTECTLLVFDILVCPYLDTKFKRQLLTAYNIPDVVLQNQLLNFKTRQKYWFTKWDKFSFLDEIEAKIANEPY